MGIRSFTNKLEGECSDIEKDGKETRTPVDLPEFGCWMDFLSKNTNSGHRVKSFRAVRLVGGPKPGRVRIVDE